MSNGKKIRGILLFGLIAVVSVCLLYYISGAPSFSPEMAMHRAERANLIGPSKVIAGDSWEFMYDQFLLGETESGYVLYEYSEMNVLWQEHTLTYAEKSDPVTVFSPGIILNWHGELSEEEMLFPIFAIPESTRAVSARLTMTAERAGAHYEVTATASLEQGVYFLFNPQVMQAHSHVRDFWYRCIKGDPVVYSGVSGSVTLELFDREGNLIETIVTEYPANQ